MRHDLERYSHTQRVPGLTQDEVKGEMLVVLWEAWDTYDPDSNTKIEQRFWTKWVDRKVELIRRFFAQKRSLYKQVSVDVLTISESSREAVDADEWFTREDMAAFEPLVTWEDVYGHQIPSCPTEDERDRLVWTLIASGFTRAEIMAFVEMSKRQYYNVINRWRTDDVRRALVVV